MQKETVVKRKGSYYMNTENFEQAAPDASLTREEAVALHDKLLASNIALSKKTAVLCFIGAVAAFIIGSIFQWLAGTTMFSLFKPKHHCRECGNRGGFASENAPSEGN